MLGLLLVPQISRAQAGSSPAAGSTVGKISAYIVSGDVELTRKGESASHKLVRGEQFEEGSFIRAMPGGNALLVFSNGATMKILENAQMAVTSYKQDSYNEAAEGTFLRLSKDPSKSTTQLDLRNGTLQGEVKQLNTTKGSKFTVDTPAGSAGIRGTVLSITVVRNAAGQVTGIIANCMVGSVAFTPVGNVVVANGAGSVISSGNANVGPEVNVNQGGQMQVNLMVDPATGRVVGGGVTGSNMGANANNDLIQAFNDAVNAAKVVAGVPITPPATVVPSTQTVTVTDSSGNTQSTSTTNAITVIPPAAPLPPIATPGVTTTPNAGGGTTTTTTTTAAPVNTNPANASADGT